MRPGRTKQETVIENQQLQEALALLCEAGMITPRQEQCIEAVLDCGNSPKAAKRLGCSSQYIRAVAKCIKLKAERVKNPPPPQPQQPRQPRQPPEPPVPRVRTHLKLPPQRLEIEDLAPRSFHPLFLAGIHTRAAVLQYGREGLLARLRGIGRKSAEEIWIWVTADSPKGTDAL